MVVIAVVHVDVPAAVIERCDGMRGQDRVGLRGSCELRTVERQAEIGTQLVPLSAATLLLIS